MNGIISKESQEYWNQRANGYSEVNWEELEGVQRQNWAKLLEKEIHQNFGDCKNSEIHVLDMGAGPGFLSIVLSELGYHVTAADYSEKMIEKAKENARQCGVQIEFRQENAEDLRFEDESFDVIVSRNLTWNLPHPQKAYKEWIRILKPKGMMLVFDANWYHYLQSEESKKGYEEDRKNVELQGVGDYNIGENFEQMERIAETLPMTNTHRPEWDEALLKKEQMKNIDIVEDIGSIVYSEKEKINYKSTPMFMIKAIRG